MVTTVSRVTRGRYGERLAFDCATIDHMAESTPAPDEPTSAEVGDQEPMPEVRQLGAAEHAVEREPTRSDRARAWVKRRWQWQLGVALTALTAAGIYNRHSWKWGDFPTWILAVGAIITAWYAIRAFRLQSEEIARLQQDRTDQQALTRQQVSVMELQAMDLRASLEERKRAAAGELTPDATGTLAQPRDAQARRVFAWQQHLPRHPGVDQVQATVSGRSRPVVAVHVKNGSEDLIRDVEIRWHRGNTPVGQFDRIAQMIPGTEKVAIREVPPDTFPEAFSAAVRFTDANNVVWIRRPESGELIERLDQTS